MPLRPRAEDDPQRVDAWRGLDAAQRSLERTLHQALVDERDMTLAWFRLVDRLQEVGGRAVVGELTAALHLPPSTGSRQLDELEAQGWIRREMGRGTDHRHVVVVLTAAGRATWRGASTTVRQVLRRSPLGAMEGHEVGYLTTLVQRLAET